MLNMNRAKNRFLRKKICFFFIVFFFSINILITLGLYFIFCKTQDILQPMTVRKCQTANAEGEMTELHWCQLENGISGSFCCQVTRDLRRDSENMMCVSPIHHPILSKKLCASLRERLYTCYSNHGCLVHKCTIASDRWVKKTPQRSCTFTLP